MVTENEGKNNVGDGPSKFPMLWLRKIEQKRTSRNPCLSYLGCFHLVISFGNTILTSKSLIQREGNK